MGRYCCFCKDCKDIQLMARVPKTPEILKEWKQVLGEDFIKDTSFIEPYICRLHFPAEGSLSHLALPVISSNTTNENKQLTTLSAIQSNSNVDKKSDKALTPCGELVDPEGIFALCSFCKYSVKRTSSKKKFLNILSCGHVLCDLCLNKTSIHVIENSFPNNKCPVCDTKESFMVHPTVHDNIAYCALHRDKQAKFYCKECMRFLCSEKECEKHPTIDVKDIVAESIRLEDDINLFQSKLKELNEMEREARSSLSKFDQTSDEIRNTFQSIIDIATQKIAEVQKAFQLERSTLTKKVENISKNVAAVNRRIQAASKLGEITRNSFPTSENLKGEAYKLAAGNILRNTLKISDNVKCTLQQLQNYQFAFKSDNRVDIIVKTLRIFFTKHTISDEVNSNDCEVPSQMSCSDKIPLSKTTEILTPISQRQTTISNNKKPIWYPSRRSSCFQKNSSDEVPLSFNSAKKAEPISLPQTIASNSEIPIRPRPFSRPSTPSLQKTNSNSIVKMNNVEAKCITEVSKTVSKGILEGNQCFEPMKYSDNVTSSKCTEILTPVTLSQTMNLNSENQEYPFLLSSKSCLQKSSFETGGLESKFIPLYCRNDSNKIPKEYISVGPRKTIKLEKCPFILKVPSSEISRILSPNSLRQGITKNEVKIEDPEDDSKLIDVFMNTTCKQESPTLSAKEAQNLDEEEKAEKICGERSTLCPQQTHSLIKSMKKIEGPVPQITPSHRREAQNKIERRSLKAGEKRKMVDPLCWMSSSHKYSNLIGVCKNETCEHEQSTLLKQKSRNENEEKVEKLSGEYRTELGRKQRIHRNHLHSEQDQEEFQNVKEEMIQIESPHILDREIKQEEPV